MTHQEALIWIKNWLDRCNDVAAVAGITDEYINYLLISTTITILH